MKMEFRVNGETVSLDVDPLKRMLDLLREDLGLTGPKEGCGEGECGACAVLVDGRLVNTCILAAGQAAGRDIVTIEGFRGTERYRVLEAAYLEAGAVQCGFCTPGMILASEALLASNPAPSVHDIRTAISGNLCRCTGYNMIVEAVLLASRKGAGLW